MKCKIVRNNLKSKLQGDNSSEKYKRRQVILWDEKEKQMSKVRRVGDSERKSQVRLLLAKLE